MNEPKRPDPVDIENVFNKFVIEYGGVLVSEMMPKDYKGKNADYYFEKELVIAELKCLKKDLFRDESDKGRIFRLFDKWKAKKLIEPGDEFKILFGAKKLPVECNKDLTKAASNSIEDAIRKANRQIRDSKVLLKQPHSKGILLLANDGNYFLSHSKFLGIIGSLMSRKFIKSDIDAFVYFTVNQVAYMPDSELDWQLWIPGYRDDNGEKLGEFIKKMGHDFLHVFIPKINGVALSGHIEIDEFNEAMDAIDRMKHIPKTVAYNKKK